MIFTCSLFLVVQDGSQRCGVIIQYATLTGLTCVVSKQNHVLVASAVTAQATEKKEECVCEPNELQNMRRREPGAEWGGGGGEGGRERSKYSSSYAAGSILGQNMSHTGGRVPTNPTTWCCMPLGQSVE